MNAGTERLRRDSWQLATKDRIQLSYLDFLPDYGSQDDKGIPSYNPFKTLIDKANDKLAAHPNLKVVSCEEFQIARYCKPWEDHDVRPDNKATIALEDHSSTVQEFNALRVWITSKSPGDTANPVRIGCKTFVPESLEEDLTGGQPQMERMDGLFKRANDYFQSQPLKGRVINMQTHERNFTTKAKGGVYVNPESTFDWFLKEDVTSCLTILRIFYQEGPAAREIIGCKDVVPIVKGVGLKAKGESFGTLVASANKWAAERPELKVVNMQSVNFRMGKAEELRRLDTSQSVFYINTDEGSNSPDLLSQILRVFFVVDGTRRRVPWSARTYKTFVPPMVRTSVSAALYKPRFEKMNKNLDRIRAWLNTAGANIVGVETGKTSIRFDSQDPEATIGYNAGHNEFTWLCFVRVYFEGEFEEPSREMLPPIPEPMAQNNCTVM